MPKTKKELTLEEAVDEVDTILEEHLSNSTPSIGKARARAFNEYVSSVCDTDRTPQKPSKTLRSRP